MTDPIADAKALLERYAQYEIGEHDWVLPVLGALEDLRAEAERLREELRTVDALNSSWLTNLAVEHQRVSALEAELAERNARLSDAADAHAETVRQCLALEAELREAKASANDMAGWDRDYRATIQRLEAENEELRRKLNPPKCGFCGNHGCQRCEDRP